MTLAAGTCLHNRYEVLEVLGEGATSTVYLVLDGSDGTRTFALKCFELRAATVAEVAEASVLFDQEIGLLRSLDHPCIPHLHDAFTEGDLRCLVMDYIDGRTLESIVDNNGPAPEPYVLPIAIQMVKLLAWLHTRPQGPVVFRDLKPSNVMVDYDGRVHLVDLGAARTWKPGQLADTFPLGTPGFAAPEQYGAAQSGPSTDLYAMAATIYRTLTAEDPEPGAARAPLRAISPDCSEEMEQVLERCLREDPRQRPHTAVEVLEALLDLQRARFPSVTVPPLPSACPPPIATVATAWSWVRHWVPMFVLGLFCVVGVAAFLAPWGHSFRPQGQATACKSNLKNIATALEMYSADNGGLFPSTLYALPASYLKRLPTCPAAAAETYSAGYRVSDGRPQAYTVVCSGYHHQGVGYSANYPQYTSTRALLER